MSTITNRRCLILATQQLVKASAPSMAEYLAVIRALEHVFSDDARQRVRIDLVVLEDAPPLTAGAEQQP